jgi:hypothetical protein
MFELGYAISQNKRIWLLLDTLIVESTKRFEQLRILTTVGYARYCNSRDIEASFYTDKPYSDLDNTIFNTAIRGGPGNSDRMISGNLASPKPPVGGETEE